MTSFLRFAHPDALLIPPLHLRPGQGPRVARPPPVELGQLRYDVSPVFWSSALKLPKKSDASRRSRWHKPSATARGTLATSEIRFSTTPMSVAALPAFSSSPPVGSRRSSFVYGLPPLPTYTGLRNVIVFSSTNSASSCSLPCTSMLSS